MKLSWSQALCDDCWNLREVWRKPYRLKDPEPEKCCDCGLITTSGIYYRLDPATVNFPRKEEEDDG